MRTEEILTMMNRIGSSRQEVENNDDEEESLEAMFGLLRWVLGQAEESLVTQYFPEY
jgi:hypothetical protein